MPFVLRACLFEKPHYPKTQLRFLDIYRLSFVLCLLLSVKAVTMIYLILSIFRSQPQVNHASFAHRKANSNSINSIKC